LASGWRFDPVDDGRSRELVVNFNTGKALGLTISPVLIAHADEVIE
jgi:hypothetical protein